jgi:serine/threonine protein kinase
MAPEVFEERYSTKADIWSVGCVAIQMASGNPPWKDLGLTNPVALFQHITKSSGSPLLNLNEVEFICGQRDGLIKMESFRNLVARCFERFPENRPNAGDLLEHIFFTEENSLSIDDQSDSDCGLFHSPVAMRSTYGNTLSSSPNWATDLSPIQRLPLRRCSSGGNAIRSPMFSPPLPRRNVGRGTTPMRMNQSPTQRSSPVPDDAEWPTWARKEILVKPAITDDQAVRESRPQYDEKTRSIMTDSLAYSDDDDGNTSMQREGNCGLLSPPLIGVSILSSALDSGS